MEKETRFRILNKTSKTVTVKLTGKPMTFSWEEFNKKLVVVDNVWAVLNEEEKKRQKEADDLVSDTVVSVMIQNGNSDVKTKMVHLMMIGKNVERIAELLECTKLEAMQIIRERLMLMNPFMTKPMFEMNKHQKSIRHHNQAAINKEEKPVPVFEEKKPTLGDAFSCLGKLKEEMDN